MRKNKQLYEVKPPMSGQFLGKQTQDGKFFGYFVNDPKKRNYTLNGSDIDIPATRRRKMQSIIK
jgi:hypothetical protein